MFWSQREFYLRVEERELRLNMSHFYWEGGWSMACYRSVALDLWRLETSTSGLNGKKWIEHMWLVPAATIDFKMMIGFLNDNEKKLSSSSSSSPFCSSFDLVPFSTTHWLSFSYALGWDFGSSPGIQTPSITLCLTENIFAVPSHRRTKRGNLENWPFPKLETPSSSRCWESREITY